MRNTTYETEAFLSHPSPWGPSPLGLLLRNNPRSILVEVTSSEIHVARRTVIPLSRITRCEYGYPPAHAFDESTWVSLEYLAGDGTPLALRFWDSSGTYDSAKLYTAISEARDAIHAEPREKPLEETFWSYGYLGAFFAALLRERGQEARLADWSHEGGYEETDQWLINVAQGPIRQVVMWSYTRYAVTDTESDRQSCGIDYLVPDPGMGYLVPYRQQGLAPMVRSVLVRRFPVFGAIIGVRWKELEGRHRLPSGVISRLRQDNSVKGAIAESERDIDIGAHFGCWVLSTHRGDRAVLGGPRGILEELGPTRRRWDCYLAIAQYLLATPMRMVE